jgi:hypothetical protein
MRNFNYFCLGLLISVGLFFVPYAHAYTDPGPLPQTTNIVKGLPGVGTNAFGTGVVATSAGDILVQPSGLRVPVTVAAQVEKAAIAKAAAKIAVRAVPFVGTAVALSDICTILCPNGYRQNPSSGAFEQIEQPSIPGDAPGTGYMVNNTALSRANTTTAACDLYMFQRDAQGKYVYAESAAGWTNVTSIVGTSSAPICKLTKTFTNGATSTSQFNMQKIANYYVPKYVLATEVQTQADVLARMEQQAKFKSIYDSIKTDQRNYVGDWPDDYNPVKATTPITVTAPPAVSPERTVKTTTKTNPDGSTETTTTKEKTVVNPTTTGTTTGDSRTTFPTQTVTTSTTVNNTTNQTTTNTEVVEHPAEEQTQQEDDDVSFVDSTMPALPELYSQKYPDGIAGVWRDNKPDIKSTAFYQGVASMFPSFSGGQCPSFGMSFQIGNIGNYGNQVFNVPCWIYQVIGLIMMVTATFTARKIIF